MLTKHPLTIVASLLVIYYLVFVCSLSFNNVLGKSVIVATVLGVSYCYGKVPGVIAAVCGMLLLHRSVEGLETNDTSEETSSKEDDKETDDTEGKTVTEEVEINETISVSETPKETESEEDDAVTQEKEAAAKSTNTVVSNEEKMRPTSSNDEVEGFANYGPNSHVEPFSLVSGFTNSLASL